LTSSLSPLALSRCLLKHHRCCDRLMVWGIARTTHCHLTWSPSKDTWLSELDGRQDAVQSHRRSWGSLKYHEEAGDVKIGRKYHDTWCMVAC
jgi:hypothetical protein